MTHPARTRRKKQHAMAARQALRLCETELPGLTWDTADTRQRSAAIQRGQSRISVVTTRAALRAAGLPPLAAAALRSRLHLIPEPEDQP